MRISVASKRKNWTNPRKGIWYRTFTSGRTVMCHEKICLNCHHRFIASYKKSLYCSYFCSSSHHQLGERSHRWRGGRMKTENGYIAILMRDHPDAVKPNFYVLEHRLVMEKKIGRRLLKSEIVHHINGDKHDNRVKNLVITSRSEHTTHHNNIRWSSRKRK